MEERSLPRLLTQSYRLLTKYLACFTKTSFACWIKGLSHLKKYRITALHHLDIEVNRVALADLGQTGASPPDQNDT